MGGDGSGEAPWAAREGIMEFHGRVVLTSILSIAVASFAVQSARAGDKPAPAPAVPAAEEKIELDTWGDIEFGGRYFIEKPRDIGRAWVTPSVQRPDKGSIAKYEEYGNVPEGAYLERLTAGAQTKDGAYVAELRATDVGNNNQRYIFDWGITGVLTGTVTWDQIPHVYSTTAQSIWNGVGTNYLTTNVNLSALASVAQADFINPLSANGIAAKNLINSTLAANLKTVKIGIDRDRFEADQRWTPTPNWEARVQYFHEKREGTQVAGVNWGGVGGSQMVQVPRPVDDTTQNAKVSGERSGDWAYGHYNVKITGGISTYDNEYSYYTVQNPFYTLPTGGTSAGCASTYNTALNASPCARVSLMPSNQAYSGNITSGIDLPFSSRFMNTVQYTTMRQDEPFMPMTIATGSTTLNTYNSPFYDATTGRTYNTATSLNGEVNALLVNNVLNTRITDDLKSTLRYRYYDNDNQTPETFWRWVSEDTALSVDRRNFGYSYTKQNASGDLTYHVLKNASVGGSAGWERIERDNREALRTDELIGKVYADARWNDIGQLRASYQYSERRYDRYDPQAWYATIYPDGTGGTSNNWGERKFDLANRDRNKGNVLFSFDNIPYLSNLSLTPSFGIRNDDYLTDPNKAYSRSVTFNNTTTTSTTYEMGLLKDYSWNGGIEAAYSFKPGTSIVFAYVHENSDRDLVGSNTLQNTATGAIAAVNTRWASNMKEDVDTFIFGANIALNDQFDFSASYSIAFGKENWTATDLSGNSACATPGSAAYLAGCMPYPTVNTNLQRVDAVLKYKFDSELVTKTGFDGDVYWKLKYSWDHSRVDNWQNDLVTPYMYLVDPSAQGRDISMAAYNPNYDVHVVATSLNFKW
jgi:MtrB/PioB family decaheme-associated outer membrane protein